MQEKKERVVKLPRAMGAPTKPQGFSAFGRQAPVARLVEGDFAGGEYRGDRGRRNVGECDKQERRDRRRAPRSRRRRRKRGKTRSTSLRRRASQRRWRRSARGRRSSTTWNGMRKRMGRTRRPWRTCRALHWLLMQVRREAGKRRKCRNKLGCRGRLQRLRSEPAGKDNRSKLIRVLLIYWQSILGIKQRLCFVVAHRDGRGREGRSFWLKSKKGAWGLPVWLKLLRCGDVHPHPGPGKKVTIELYGGS